MNEPCENCHAPGAGLRICVDYFWKSVCGSFDCQQALSQKPVNAYKITKAKEAARRTAQINGHRFGLTQRYFSHTTSDLVGRLKTSHYLRCMNCGDDIAVHVRGNALTMEGTGSCPASGR